MPVSVGMPVSGAPPLSFLRGASGRASPSAASCPAPPVGGGLPATPERSSLHTRALFFCSTQTSPGAQSAASEHWPPLSTRAELVLQEARRTKGASATATPTPTASRAARLRPLIGDAAKRRRFTREAYAIVTSTSPSLTA